MLIFTKNIENEEDFTKEFVENSCDEVSIKVKSFIDTYINNIKTEDSLYEKYLKSALEYCTDHLPSPMSMAYPYCANITVGSRYFILRFERSFGIGIKILTFKDGSLKYQINLSFEKDLVFARSMPFYRQLLLNGWDVKEFKSHK